MGEDASGPISDMKEVSSRIKELEAGMNDIQEKLDQLIMVIPHMPNEEVPVGKG